MIYRSESIDATTRAVTVEAWDTATGTYTRTINGAQVEQRALTADEAAVFAARAQEEARIANERELRSVATVQAKIDGLKTFLSDVDVQKVLDQTNNQAMSTADLNRALKVIVRQLRRQANATIAAYRLASGVTDSLDGTTGA